MDEHLPMGNMLKKNLKPAITLAFFGFIILIAMSVVGIINVSSTQVAVEIDKLKGEVKKDARGVGYHFYNRWTTDMILYKIAARSFPQQSMATEGHKEYNMELKTNDGQNVSIDMTIIYGLDPKQVPQLHQTVGVNYEDQILLPQVRSEARIAIGGYSAEEIYQGKVRDEIQNQIKDKLAEKLSKFPAIMVHDALIRHFEFSPQFETAIESKKLAAQQVEVNRNRALAQEEESKRMEAEAKGMKLRAIQDAQGRAESAKIEADGERYKLEQEAAGQLALYKAEAEGKRLSADALGGGQNVVALEFAKNIPDKLQIWGIPTGQQSTSLMDLSGVFKGMLKPQDKE